jgi:glycine oxidase
VLLPCPDASVFFLAMTKTKIVIAGCGIIGAILAYELSRLDPHRPDLDIRVIDRQPPARASTGAALGVMMGAISLKKAKSRAWKLRRDSLVRYETLIPELIATTGRSIPYNRHGILKLCTSLKPPLERWQTLAAERREQQFQIDILTSEATADRFPYVNLDQTIAAVYSLDDRQVEPVPLLEAAIAAAQLQGVRFDWDGCIESGITDGDRLVGITLRRSSGAIETVDLDVLMITAGAGSAAIAKDLVPEGDPLTIMNVLGQALHLRPRSPIPANHPVITCDDIHVVPRSDGTVWVGATLEFPPGENPDPSANDPIPDPQALDQLRTQATRFYPALENADVISSWQGMRPRPIGRSAPVIEPIAGLTNVLLATAHYRNGVLLAPATAQRAIDWLQQTQILDQTPQEHPHGHPN